MSFVFVGGHFEQNAQNYYNILDFNSATCKYTLFLSFVPYSSFFDGRGERGRCKKEKQCLMKEKHVCATMYVYK